jgi:hypothetical protein
MTSEDVEKTPGNPEVEDTQDPEVAALLEAVPEFAGRYVELIEECDGYPGSNEAFTELAEFIEDLAANVQRFHPVLVNCFQAVEEIVASADDAEALIGWSFLDYLSTEARQAILPWLGPRTVALLESIEDPTSGFERPG